MQNAENKLYRTINLRNEETALSVSISSGLATVPTDFKALKIAYFAASPVELLEWVAIEQLYIDYPTRSGANLPAVISREGGSFTFGPFSQDGTLEGIYYAKQDGLRDTDNSWYVTNAPELLLYMSLLEAAPFIQNDERIPVWESFAREAAESLKTEEDNASFSQTSLMTKAS